MNIIENNLVELNNAQLREVSGGTFFTDLGVAAHMVWNTVDGWFESHPDLTSHSRQGI